MILDKHLQIYIKNKAAQTYYKRITNNTIDIHSNVLL